VAGGDHHAAGRAQIFYRVGKGGRGCVVVGELDRNAGPGDDLRRSLGKAARAKARVIADDDPVLRVFILQHIGRDGPSHAADVLEGIVVGDHAAPAIGTELDFRNH
jgi:hypothetical protein